MYHKMINHHAQNLKRLYRFATLITLGLLIVTCTHTPQVSEDKPPFINELIITNKTDGALKEVRLNVLDTKRFIACSIILPKTACSLGFKKTSLEEHPTTLTWSQNSNVYTRRVKALNAQPEREVSTVHVDIHDDGKLSTYFK